MRINILKKSKKKIYLDVCALCRPFDDQSYIRIRQETDAINLILSCIKDKYYELIISPVHLAEINDIAYDIERLELLSLIDKIGEKIKNNSSNTRMRAEEFVSKGFGIADAAHLAFAEINNSTFISCDDKLIKKCKKNKLNNICVNPVIFCEMENIK